MKVIPERFVKNCIKLAHKRLGHGEHLASVLSDLIHDVYAMGASAEREECAKVCDEETKYWKQGQPPHIALTECAAAIRARGQSEVS